MSRIKGKLKLKYSFSSRQDEDNMAFSISRNLYCIALILTFLVKTCFTRLGAGFGKHRLIFVLDIFSFQ